jgi:hypothetical protein
LKKKQQKNFWTLVRWYGRHRTKLAKVFWFSRPDDGTAKPFHLNRAAQYTSKKNFFLA